MSETERKLSAESVQLRAPAQDGTSLPSDSRPPVVIQATNLTKIYGKQSAVDGIDFEVRRGETFGLLGPNGAGKVHDNAHDCLPHATDFRRVVGRRT